MIKLITLFKRNNLPFSFQVTIPVRFMFILLGPPNADLDYHEVGRSISTLMSNPVRHLHITMN